MDKYYSDKLSAEELLRCYEIAPPRVRQYLDAEILHIVKKIKPTDTVLELGCGYGRVIRDLCSAAKTVIGIDTSLSSLKFAREQLHEFSNYQLYLMDAVHLGFRENTFDITICVQNGISAFKVDRLELMREAVRITRPKGMVLFSSYSNRFWNDRLEWFQLQSEEGLLGDIDYDQTGDGIIVCKDGLRATTVSPEQFLALASRLNQTAQTDEVDNSSIFCEIIVE